MQINTEDKRQALFRQFRAFLGPDSVIGDAETMRPYECDALSVYTQMPLLVLMPETTEQVQQIMRLCSRERVAVVPRGAGTGVSAGALPLADGVLLSLEKMNRLLEVDPLARTARVQPGMRNLAVSEAVAAYGLFYGPDPSSQLACSIGGNISENSGGVHCLKYGLTVHNVLGLKVVTVEGELVTLGSDGLDTAGPDLLAAFIGSEGLLGVVTEITVKLLPLPTKVQVMLAAFDEVQKAGDAVGGIIGSGIIPAGLEMMDARVTAAVEDFVHAGYPTDAAAVLICELDGTEAEVDENMARVADLMREFGATSTRISRDDKERALIWKGRKSAFPALGKLAPDYYCLDGSIPRSQISRVLTRIAELSEEFGLEVVNVFHAGDGNLHPLVLFDANVPGQFQIAEELGGRILEFCYEVGGTITGEHGVGIEKLRQMPVQFSPAELGQFEAVKYAFDPNALLNPGKGIPLLKYCQEYRALGVENANVQESTG